MYGTSSRAPSKSRCGPSWRRYVAVSGGPARGRAAKVGAVIAAKPKRTTCRWRYDSGPRGGRGREVGRDVEALEHRRAGVDPQVRSGPVPPQIPGKRCGGRAAPAARPPRPAGGRTAYGASATGASIGAAGVLGVTATAGAAATGSMRLSTTARPAWLNTAAAYRWHPGARTHPL